MHPLLTVAETARFLRVKPGTLYTWAYRGQIPAQKVRKSLRFHRSDLEAWLKQQVRRAKV